MTLVTVPPDPKALNRLRKKIAFFPIFAGLALLPLLFIGYIFGVQDHSYQISVGVHLFFLILATIASLGLFAYNVRRSALSPVLLVGALVVFLLLILVLASVPITSRDALIHHLAVPKWWLERGTISKIAWHEWSFYPMLINLAYTSFLGWGLEFLTPYYHAIYLLLLCGTVASFVLYKSQDHDAAALSFLMTLSMPAFFKLATVPLVDLALAFYCAHAIFHFVYWLEGKHRSSHLFVVGLAFGLALGCKYNAMLALGLSAPIGFLLMLRSKVRFWHYLFAPLVLGVCVICVYAPWAGRNYLWTNNPIYPLFNGFFGVGTAPEIFKGFSPIATRALLYNEPWYMTLLIPVRMLFSGQDDIPERFDGLLSPILLLAAVAVWRLRKDANLVGMGLYAAAYFTFALLLNSARVRYMAPIFGPLVVLSTLAIWELVRNKFPHMLREVYLMAAIAFLIWGDFYVAGLLRSQAVLEYWLTPQSKVEYLRENIPEYAMIEYINRTLPDDSRTYLLNTGNRFYYYDKPVISGGYHSGSLLISWIRNSSSASDLSAKIKSRGLTHLMVNTALTLASFQGTLSEEEVARWNEFQNNYLRLEHLSGGFSLWVLS